MAKAIVTGGAGFIGANLALELQRQKHDVVVIDDFLKGNFKNLLGFEGEIIPESFFHVDLSIYDADVVFHQAAITDTTVTDQKHMLQVNTYGFQRLLEYCVKKNIPLVYASSAATYGSAPSPLKEEHAGSPSNVYGYSKWLCDMLVTRYLRNHPKAHVVGLRYFNVFGPREKFKGNMASMIWQLAQQMAADKKPRVFKYGEQARDQVYVKDVVYANLLAWKAKQGCIVNVGSGKATSFNKIIESLNHVLGKNLETEYFDNPYTEFYQNFTQADLTNVKKYLDYTPQWEFADAVHDYIKEENMVK